MHEKENVGYTVIRHSEMRFIADAGSSTSSKAFCPLSPDVEYLNLDK